MSERFLKFIPSQEAMHLIRKHPKAFILLTFIAERARREHGHPDGLTIGQCHIGDWENMGLTRQEYRTALSILILKKIIEKVETCRTRKKSTTGSTTVGSLVKLCDARIYDINAYESNHRPNHRATTDQPPTNHEEERRRKKKKEKEYHPSIPSSRKNLKLRDADFDDFSPQVEKGPSGALESKSSKVEIAEGIFLTPEDLQACIVIKGTIEEVRKAVAFIQASKKRKRVISDWPKALATWKIEDEVSVRIRNNILYSESLCTEFRDFSDGHGWRCHMHNDTLRDQRGLLFVHDSPYEKAHFFALVDSELKEKCEKFIENNAMRRYD